MSSEEFREPGHAPPAPMAYPPPPSAESQPQDNKKYRWVAPFVAVAFVLGAAGLGYWVLRAQLTERQIERTGVEFFDSIAAAEDLTRLLDDHESCVAPELFRQTEPVAIVWSPYANAYAIRTESTSSFAGNSTTLNLGDIRPFEAGRPRGTDYGLAYGELTEDGEVFDFAVLVTKEPDSEWMVCSVLTVEE